MRMDAISPREWELLEDRLGVHGRQMDVVRVVASGKSQPKVIARTLGIGVASVKTHLQRVFGHLGVHSKLELAVMVFTLLLEMRLPRKPGQPGDGRGRRSR